MVHTIPFMHTHLKLSFNYLSLLLLWTLLSTTSAFSHFHPCFSRRRSNSSRIWWERAWIGWRQKTSDNSSTILLCASNLIANNQLHQDLKKKTHILRTGPHSSCTDDVDTVPPVLSRYCNIWACSLIRIKLYSLPFWSFCIPGCVPLRVHGQDTQWNTTADRSASSGCVVQKQREINVRQPTKAYLPPRSALPIFSLLCVRACFCFCVCDCFCDFFCFCLLRLVSSCPSSCFFIVTNPALTSFWLTFYFCSADLSPSFLFLLFSL